MTRKHADSSRIRVYPLLAAKVLPYQKAIMGALTGGLSLLVAYANDGLTSNEWWQILAAAAAGSGLVYAVPNKDPKGKKQAESVQPPTHERIRDHLDRKGIR